MKRSHARIALVAGVVCAPILLDSLPGNWFDEGGEGLDRNIEPLDLPDAVHVAICVLAAAALVVSVLVLVSSAGRRVSTRDEFEVAAPMLVAGLYVAFTYRVSTAAVTGANIGGGFLFLLGVPLVPGLLALAGRNAFRHRRPVVRRRRRSNQGSDC